MAGGTIIAWILMLMIAGVRDEPLRPTISLDGEWQFRLDPDDASGSVAFRQRIRVPGAWDAQGFGEPTDKLNHNYVGKAWYKREVIIPADWADRRVFLCVGGVHRYADVWVNNQHLGEHIGYLSPFEYELTGMAKPGAITTIAIQVDSKQRWEIDALTGCFDMIDAMFTVWGGIWGHVWLESRPAAWLENVYVSTHVDPLRANVQAQVAGDRAAVAGCRLTITDAAGTTIWQGDFSLSDGKDNNSLRLETQIPGVKLWSPDAPTLYTAAISLKLNGEAADEVRCRFGFREITTREGHFLLNGKRLFLRGYGDDAIYPETMAAPSKKDFYLQRLRRTKSYGFNFVRHHSHMMPPEYYDAADEVGMLISAEFPIAYDEYYQRAKGPALDLYKSEWAAAIVRLRNHPSIFDWSMSNEMWGGFPLAADLYAAAKLLDPTRLVIDSDGLSDKFVGGTVDRPTLDFYSVQFNCHALPLDQPEKHRIPVEPRKPIICHETGNYTTFPRMQLIDAFRLDNIKPFWLTPMKAKLEKLGLLEEAQSPPGILYPRPAISRWLSALLEEAKGWPELSERLYLLSYKLNLEDLRKNPRISGYEWWLFQDYWTGTNGLVDCYFCPKAISPGEVKQFNNDVVLLQDGFAANLRGETSIAIQFQVSNLFDESIQDAVLSCEASPTMWKNAEMWLAPNDDTDYGRSRGGPPQPRKWMTIPLIEQGDLASVMEWKLDLPKVETPVGIRLWVHLSAQGRAWDNEWTARVFPSKIESPKLPVPVFASQDLLEAFSRFGAKPIPAAEALPPAAVFVTSQLDLRLLNAVASGSCVLCISPKTVLPSVANRFKPAWWLGSPEDCNLGTVVYKSPVTEDLAPDGWCDAGWYHLLEGSRAYVLDEYPAQPDVLIRGIDLHTLCRSKALLFQAKVGEGSLIVSGLNWRFDSHEDLPEAEYLLNRLMAYAGGLPKPKAELPVQFLRERIEHAPTSQP